jgi:hypothetical protein
VFLGLCYASQYSGKRERSVVNECVCYSMLSIIMPVPCAMTDLFLSERKRKSRLDFRSNRVKRAYSGAEWPKISSQDF